MKSVYWRVIGYLRPYRGLLMAAMLATFGFALFDALSIVAMIPLLNALFHGGVLDLTRGGSSSWMTWLMAHSIGELVPAGMSAPQALLRINLFILTIFLIKNVFDFFQTYLVVRLEQSVTRDLRQETYAHLLNLDMRFFGATRAGQIISRLTSDADKLRELVTNNLAKFVTSILQAVITIVIMLWTSVPLTIVGLVVLPAMFGIWGRFLKRLRRGDRNVRNLEGEVASHLQETVLGVRQVKAAGAEKFEVRRFAEGTQEYYKAVVRNERVRALASPLTEMLGALATIMLIWYGSQLVLVKHTLLPETFIVFLGLSLKMYVPVKWLSKFPATVQPGLVSAERIFEFLDAPFDIAEIPTARDLTTIKSGITFENVGFAYQSGRPVLENIDLEVPAGTVVALVGPSGAGKSTLVDLVARFYDPTTGRIAVDGVDLKEFKVSSLRKHLGIVSQDTILFHDTVRANIAYALPNAKLEDIERAARAANAHEFITNLPNGYDTILGERGTRLSGGQRQRLAIARAILRDPPILILDEATSALDSESERLVQAAMDKLLRGRTVFVIAHRLSTVRNADQIVVLDNGRIVQRGNHDQLLLEGGLYSHLHKLQIGDPTRSFDPTPASR